eukprot:366072-Chlamydomonas_euryale.AAC.2
MSGAAGLHATGCACVCPAPTCSSCRASVSCSCEIASSFCSSDSVCSAQPARKRVRMFGIAQAVRR